jgi:hypothetical protein
MDTVEVEISTQAASAERAIFRCQEDGLFAKKGDLLMAIQPAIGEGKGLATIVVAMNKEKILLVEQARQFSDRKYEKFGQSIDGLEPLNPEARDLFAALTA